jgi:hypothetical protein
MHRQDLSPGQIAWWEGIRVVTVATAIAQCLHSGVPTYLLRQAVDNAFASGVIAREDQDHFLDDLGRRDADRVRGSGRKS